VAEEFVLGGILEAENTAVVTAEISGTVNEQFFREGDSTNKGDILLRFDKEPSFLNLESAKAGLRKAEVSYENSRSEFERRTKLREEGFFAEEKVESARRLFLAAEADLAVAVSSLHLAQRDMNKTEVLSPIPGIIVQRFREVGEQVPPGTPLFKISDLGTLRIVAGLSEEQILYVKEREKVDVRFKPFGDKVFTGIVKRTGIPASEHGGTFPVEIILENSDPRLKPGMVSRVVFTGRMNTGIFLVPRNVVIKSLGQERVYRVRDNSAVSVAVETGRDFGFHIAVTKGLTVGDQVVIIGQDQLYDGASVHVRRIIEEIDQ
jgi:membrane fusion protein (multidrug efflux system)